MRIAIILFLASFTSITCWLTFREPPTMRVTYSTEEPDDTAKADGKVPAADDIHPAKRPVAISDAEQAIRSKLDNIIIPEVDFENTTIEEAIDFVRFRARELDTTSTESTRGMSFVIEAPQFDHDPNLGADATLQPDLAIKTITLRGNNMKLGDILNQICQQTGYELVLTDHGVRLITVDQ